MMYSISPVKDRVDEPIVQNQMISQCRSLPDVIIIGARKCGTKALLEILGTHPNIAAASDEIFFFDKHYEEGVNWYIHQMPLSVSSQLTMEKTPDYFTTLEAPQKLAVVNKDAKLLLILRDPVIRSISDYTHFVAKKLRVMKPIKPYDEMVLTTDEGVRKVRGSQHNYGSILYDSYYDKHYANWRKVKYML